MADLARTDPGVLGELCKEIGYTAETVTAVDAKGRQGVKGGGGG